MCPLEGCYRPHPLLNGWRKIANVTFVYAVLSRKARSALQLAKAMSSGQASASGGIGPGAERGVSSQHASSGGIGDSARVAKLMEDIRALGRIPKEYKGTADEAKRAESRVAERYRQLRFCFFPRHKRKSWPV